MRASRARVAQAVLMFAAASLACVLLTSLAAPGWSHPPTERPLRPQPAGGVPSDLGQGSRQESSEVSAANGEPLPAWLVLPARPSSEPVPGVVLVPGAGPATRERMINEAQQLADAGIASISYGKRRTGYSALSRDYEQLAADAVQAAEVLARTPGVDPNGVGILGLSEGGWVAPTAVQRQPDRFAFLVLVSAPIVTPLEEAAWVVDQGLSSTPDWVRRMPAAALASGRGVFDYLGYDVRPTLSTITLPVCAVWGAEDATVPVSTAARRLGEAAPGPVSMVVLPGAGHRLPPESGWLAGLADWIRSPPAEDTVTGVEPASRAGVATTPRTSWINQPIWSILVAAALAVGVVRRPQTRLDSCGIKIQPAR